MKDLPKEMGGLGETLPSSPLRGGMTVHQASVDEATPGLREFVPA
jgi:hypothetical protein